MTFNKRSWSLPVTIESKLGTYGPRVSCSTIDFCVAVDEFGRALSYNGQEWSGPTTISAAAKDLTSVSCPTTSFCMAVDSQGNAHWT
jgi:hypothetical protein